MCNIELVHCFCSVQESMKASPEDVQLDVYLMNGQKVALNIQSTDRTDDVLEVTYYLIPWSFVHKN